MRVITYEIIYAETPDQLSCFIKKIIDDPKNYSVQLYGSPFTYNGPCGFRICQAIVEYG
jgi:hypothetical protein